MSCYSPLTGYHSKEINKNGNRPLTFRKAAALINVPMLVPCGRCIGCRLDKSREWAIRCVNEASLYDENCFITLTYNDAFLPEDGSLKVEHFQKFMKRLRKHAAPRKIRFFQCGEYGELLSRPHYHACLFNYDFADKIPFKGNGASELSTSETLEKLWPWGFSTVGEVTFDSAAYVARYVMKKWSKENLKGEELHEAMSALTDEELKQKHYKGKKPEYITMSRRPGIGTDWYNKYKDDIYPNGFAVLKGKKVPPPKFYDKKYLIDNEIESIIMTGKRVEQAQEDPENTRKLAKFGGKSFKKFLVDRKRLKQKEKHKKLQSQLKQRSIEK